MEPPSNASSALTLFILVVHMCRVAGWPEAGGKVRPLPQADKVRHVSKRCQCHQGAQCMTIVQECEYTVQ